MHRVLSFQMGRGFGESSEFVTKRMCFSFIFFIAFLALLGGFLLGRFSTERTAKLREERKRIEDEARVTSVTESTGQSENLLIEEMLKISREPIAPKMITEEGNDPDPDRIKNVRSILSDYHLFDKILDQRSSIVATIRGSREPDRWIVLSVSGDGIESAFQLAKIFAKLRVDRNWKPRRTIVFRFFDDPRHLCCDGLPKYLKARIIACLGVHGNAIQRNGCFVASGSDLVTSSVREAVTTVWRSIYTDNRVLDSCKNPEETESLVLDGPRLPSDLPHASLAFLSTVGNGTNVGAEMETRTLTRIIGLTVWRFSENPVLHWDPKYLEKGVRKVLDTIISGQFSDVKVISERILSTIQELIVETRNFFDRDNRTRKSDYSLSSRMTNDLVMDLDRELLCPDADLQSKTDLASVPVLLSKSPDMLTKYLENLLKCYQDASEVLKEG